jgi:hypothetical protein
MMKAYVQHVGNGSFFGAILCEYQKVEGHYPSNEEMASIKEIELTFSSANPTMDLLDEIDYIWQMFPNAQVKLFHRATYSQTD